MRDDPVVQALLDRKIDDCVELAREIRERIATEIETADVPGKSTDWSLAEGIEIAVRIVRGEA
jgi:hypothetical protein